MSFNKILERPHISGWITLVSILVAILAWLFPVQDHDTFDQRKNYATDTVSQRHKEQQKDGDLNTPEKSEENPVEMFVDMTSHGDGDYSVLYAEPTGNQAWKVEAATVGNNSTKVIDLRTDSR